MGLRLFDFAAAFIISSERNSKMVHETHPVIKLVSSIALLWDVVCPVAPRGKKKKNPFQPFTGSPEPSVSSTPSMIG